MEKGSRCLLYLAGPVLQPPAVSPQMTEDMMLSGSIDDQLHSIDQVAPSFTSPTIDDDIKTHLYT
jgi:hypothetical protein